jgi:hypothetical protein
LLDGVGSIALDHLQVPTKVCLWINKPAG